MRVPIKSVIIISVTSQVLTGKDPTRNQEQTSRDETSLQGPTLKGCAAAPATSPEPTGQEKK